LPVFSASPLYPAVSPGTPPTRYSAPTHSEIHNVYLPSHLDGCAPCRPRALSGTDRLAARRRTTGHGLPRLPGLGRAGPACPATTNSKSSSALPTKQTLHAWDILFRASAWLLRGSELFAHPYEHRVSGIEGWFGAAGQRPPRWKQAVAIWLAFFPVSLLFNFVLSPCWASWAW
jgi:hypothetical protein